ncbi:MAG TPA: 3-methyl-2-oxobutanoate hydroxymethyltransferase [Candidatus Cybelea sp.]|nr:3-methyl-2-oxobutanoate hydroxymethyltransferase [Candidatus Cybelea sp.]
MSRAPLSGNGKVTVPEILSRKSAAETRTENRITCLTVTDYPVARLLDEAGIDILLVGDSLGMVALGYENTLPVTLDEMLVYVRAARRGTRHALLVADMPYGSYHVSIEESVRNAIRLVKEGGAEAVKIEGGERRIELIARLVDAEIPVMGHVGLTPQSVNSLGGFRVQGRAPDSARQVERDARAVEAAGAFAVVLESVPRELAARITEKLSVPTIGIGAGPDCDGQVLVFHDFAGLTMEHAPRFARRYANLATEISRAASQYLGDVRAGRFPSDAESYHSSAEVRTELERQRT